MKIKSFIWIIVVWVILIVISSFWNFHLINSQTNKIALNKSRSFFEQIVTTRTWNAEHGGVYVPITDKTQPNPYLEDSLRDITTTKGLKLTKINPAFMTRQISEVNKEIYDLQFHITSLNPIRPANKADSWETKALKSFENGTKEVIEVTTDNSIRKYRYMAPLITEQSCLQCHAKQGYQEGDIRGGISVSFPSALYVSFKNKQIISGGLVHFIIFCLGAIGILLFYKKTQYYFSIINKKNKELQLSNNTKDKIFSIIAHDLISPFNVIQGYSNILKNQYSEFNEEEIRDFIIKIDTSSVSTLELLQNLLIWAKSQNRKISLKKENIQLFQLVSESIKAYQPASDVKKLKTSNQIVKNIKIFVDKPLLKIVIANLYNNAIKFSPDNSEIIISSQIKTNEVEFCIKDYGVGIPKETIPKLFLDNENISTKGTANETGTGLGLMLCKEFIEMHGGNIWVESELGVGSKFLFTIPKS